MRDNIQRFLEIQRSEGIMTALSSTKSYINNRYFPNESRESCLNATKLYLDLLQDREDLVAAEIGVWEGANAEDLLNQLDIDELFLIDPYDAYDEYPERKSEPNKMSEAQKTAHNKLDGYDNVTWIEKYSTEAIADINRELDFVFVDGNHHYEYVKSDIKNYYSLLNEGGIIAGDDANWIGVAQAVTEFAIENELQPHFENHYSDWFFIKGRSIDTTEPLPHSEEAHQVTKDAHEI